MFRQYWLILAIRVFLYTSALLLCVSLHAVAGDVNHISVTAKNGIYSIDISATIDAPEKYIRQVLTDYAHVYRLNNSVLASKVMQSPVPGHVRVRSRVLCCTSLFCQELTRVDDIHTLASGDLQAVIVPENSDFLSGTALWQMHAVGDQTNLSYKATIEPGFFIPPLLGTALVIQSMRKEFRTTFQRIQRIAQIFEAREQNKSHLLVDTGEPDKSLSENRHIAGH